MSTIFFPLITLLGFAVMFLARKKAIRPYGRQKIARTYDQEAKALAADFPNRKSLTCPP